MDRWVQPFVEGRLKKMTAPHMEYIDDVLKTDDLNLLLITKRMFAEREGPSAYVTDRMARKVLVLVKFFASVCRRHALAKNSR